MAVFSDDEIAFLRAIWAKPQDDVAKLAYADWLEGNGFEERAAFIRSEIEKATPKTEDRDPYPNFTPTPQQLREWFTEAVPEALWPYLRFGAIYPQQVRQYLDSENFEPFFTKGIVKQFDLSMATNFGLLESNQFMKNLSTPYARKLSISVNEEEPDHYQLTVLLPKESTIALHFDLFLHSVEIKLPRTYSGNLSIEARDVTLGDSDYDTNFKIVFDKLVCDIGKMSQTRESWQTVDELIKEWMLFHARKNNVLLSGLKLWDENSAVNVSITKEELDAARAAGEKERAAKAAQEAKKAKSPGKENPKRGGGRKKSGNGNSPDGGNNPKKWVDQTIGEGYFNGREI